MPLENSDEEEKWDRVIMGGFHPDYISLRMRQQLMSSRPSFTPPNQRFATVFKSPF
jgi:hypothetical protein